MYSCKQIHSEFIQSIERHGGLTFEFELALVGIPYPLLFEEYYPIDREEVWLTPAVLPLCLPSQNDNLSFPQAATTCKRLHVSIKAQSELNFRWHGNGGLSWTTRSLFTMLARFLLYGPLGLFKNLGTGAEWNISNLFIDITGIGATFEDPHNGRLRTVPSGVIENVEVNLSEWLDILCRSGALSGRIHTVHLALDGEIKRYWSIEEGKSLPSAVKKDWGDYGWIITRQDIRRRPKTVPKHRKWSPISRCTLQ
ncbi:hypothetical protein D9757_007249 [Collybiopsis confluens]|uniref:Uncharacterized protein n=1 Tax=Collybiopsis confluens TaxID=2823264 RepID=A0A8H5M3F4_9AGAR|nr:hypothetical protein D9757_007249 [Collybiopsis confluens]